MVGLTKGLVRLNRIFRSSKNYSGLSSYSFSNSRLLCTIPKPEPKSTTETSSQSESKIDEAPKEKTAADRRGPAGSTADSKKRSSSFSERSSYTTDADFEPVSTDPTFVGKLINRFKTRIEREATVTLPSVEKLPLIQGFTLNEIDKSMLVFPEFDETSEVMELESFAQRIERLFMEKLDPVECDRTRRIPDEFLNACKEFGLFGMHVPKEYGGLGLNHKGVARCNEELSREWSVYTMLNVHNDLVIQAIKLFGTDQQKQKYLPRLASGRSIGAFCLHEDVSGQDVAAIETTANFVDVQQTKLVINGTKTWIANAVNADILLVFAKLKSTAEQKNVASTAFIIDRKETGGITDIDRKDTTGLRALNISGLNFNQSEIGEGCILGVRENGFHVATKTMCSNRYAFASASAACLKRIFDATAQHCNATKRWGVMLSDSNAIRGRLANIAANIYALESMAYFMAGWLDDDPTKDFSLEGAVATRFARKVLKADLLSFMEIMGAESFATTMDFERILRDVVTISGFVATDDVLSGYVAMESFKVFAAEHKTILYKAKNAIEFPWHRVFDNLKRKDLYREAYKHKHYINEHVHPSLEFCCRFMEETLMKFEHIFKAVVYSTGKTVEEEHIVLNRVTDILTNLFIMITAISRASRSYCIGLRNSDEEMRLTDILCTRLRIETLHILQEMTELDCPHTMDIAMKELAVRLLNQRGYAIEKPVARNW